MLLSIIIVSYNTKALTLQTIDSVVTDLATTPELQHQTEIIVIDNNSTDGSVTALKKRAEKLPMMSVIANTHNGGFSQANNQGIVQSQGELVLLLNSDTIVKAGALVELVHAFTPARSQAGSAVLHSHHGQLDRLGIVSALLLNPDGTIQPQGGDLPSLWSVANHLLGWYQLPVVGRWLPATQYVGSNLHALKGQQLVQQGWVAGTAMVIKRAVFDEIGFFDDRIFMYGEDVEFCLRAQDHHWDVAVHPLAKVIHFGSASSSSSQALFGEFKGYLYIWSKHFPTWQMPLLKFILQLGALLRLVIFGTMGKTAKVTTYRTVLKMLSH